VSRKISGGTRSKKGSETKSILASLFGTWRLQNLNPFEQTRNLLLQASCQRPWTLTKKTRVEKMTRIQPERWKRSFSVPCLFFIFPPNFKNKQHHKKKKEQLIPTKGSSINGSINIDGYGPLCRIFIWTIMSLTDAAKVGISWATPFFLEQQLKIKRRITPLPTKHSANEVKAVLSFSNFF